MVNSWVQSLLPLRLRGPFPTCRTSSQISLAVGTGGITQVIYQTKGTESLITQEGCANLGGCVLPTETPLEKPIAISELKKRNAKEQHLAHR